MTWIKLDAGFPDHPKVVAAGWRAAWLYVCGLTYCSRYLTDGRIPKAQVRRLSDVPKAEAEAENLVRVGLWVDDEEDYVVHDYTVWQTASEKVDAIKERGKERAKRSYDARAKKQRSSGEDIPKTPPLFADPSPEESSLDVDVDVEASSSSDGARSEMPASVEEEEAEEEAEEEDDDEAMQEARRRLLHTTAQVVNPTAWVCKTARQLRSEGWTPAAMPVAVAPPKCLVCKDVPLSEPCEECGL